MPFLRPEPGGTPDERLGGARRRRRAVGLPGTRRLRLVPLLRPQLPTRPLKSQEPPAMPSDTHPDAERVQIELLRQTTLTVSAISVD